jgi:hypothetical protein
MVLTMTVAYPASACNTGRFSAIPVVDFLNDFRGTRQWRGPLTASQVEAEVVERLHSQSPDQVAVPSADWYDTWNNLKRLARPQDEYYWFSSSKESWDAQTGSHGYALVCDGTVIGTIVVGLS